jgi:FkbM family methyltransferase
MLRESPLLTELLVRTRLCRLFLIRGEDFRLRFYPSRLSKSLWRQPTLRTRGVFPRRYLRPGDRVIDVGANIGSFAIPAAREVTDTGRVYAIEPHPRIFEYCRRNVRLNRLTNVELFQTALGPEAGVTRLSDRLNDTMNYVDPEAGTIEVPVTRLDDLPLGDGPIALLKIDTEGFEKFVLEGAPATLARTLCVYYEALQRHWDRYGYGLSAVNGLLRGHGFTILLAEDEGRLCRVPPACEGTTGFREALERQKNLLAVRDPEAFAGRCGAELAA